MRRLKVLLWGLLAGTAYALLCMCLVQWSQRTVSIGYVFALPLVMGALPVLLSTKAQLKHYLAYLILPWGTVLLFFYLALLLQFEGMICLTIIVAPFLVLGSLGAFVFRLFKLRQQGDRSPKLYLTLVLPFAILLLEEGMVPEDYYGTVETSVVVEADGDALWQQIINVRNIQAEEIEPFFIHTIGVPPPLDARLSHEGVGGVRHIHWAKGIRFREEITDWQPGQSFAYNIIVNPADIPPNTLDEHVMIGGKYFDVVRGSYRIEKIDSRRFRVTLSSTYRITTTLNAYGRFWADLAFEDFHRVILRVIQKRSEAITAAPAASLISHR